jgi:hypothetical protein
MGALSLGSNHWPERGYVRGPDEEGDVAGLSGTQKGHLNGAVLGSSISCALLALATVLFTVCLTPVHVSCAYSVTTQDIPLLSDTN